ncbi:hypothetical protein LUZ60_010997 [Juncus effusus]|nr:hypothetical protein LUZ60_010997 [Juncus effusus]
MANQAPVSEQKKRAFDALERRFAAAKVQSEQQLKPQKKTRTGDASPKPRTDVPSSSNSVALTGKAGISVGVVSAQKKGSTSVDGENHPIYTEISESIHENLLQGANMETSRKDSIERMMSDMIQKGEESSKFAKGSKTLKRENWVLLDNFIPKDDKLENAREKALKSHSKRSKIHMSTKQHKKCGSFNFPKEFHNFERFKPMNEMWKEYINEVVKEKGKKQLSERFLVADLHGAFLLVVECKIESYKGKSGIMIRETTETFGIISQDNRFYVVPKAGSVFILQMDFWKITLFGDKLSAKERSKESKVQQKLQALLR